MTWIQSVWIYIPIYLLLAVGLWARHFPSPSAGFLTGHMGLVTVSIINSIYKAVVRIKSGEPAIVNQENFESER